MHIEPGVLSSVKLAYANQTAFITTSAFLPSLLRKPEKIIRTGLAALFFSILMQLFHAPIGASELHLIGASTIYCLFGFIPTLLGFALGLLLQGLAFEPTDLIHLGVNALSLMLPLISAHALIGRRFIDSSRAERAPLTWRSVAGFDSIFYGGVVTMVGFWLLNSSASTPLAQWGWFALAYLPLVLLEPLLTLALVRLIQGQPQTSWLCRFTVVNPLHQA